MPTCENVFSNVYVELLQQLHEFKELLFTRIEREVWGQHKVLEEILVALLTNSHILLTGVPGLGKSQIARLIAGLTSLKYNHLQLTSDLTPEDLHAGGIILGGEGENKESFSSEDVFWGENVLFVNDVNRTPPKKQVALLNIIRNRALAFGRQKCELKNPFFVIATQNPMYETCYPLSESQLDFFLFSSKMEYPKASDEVEMTLRATCEVEDDCTPLITREKLLEYQGLVRHINISREIAELAVKVVRKTRPQSKIATSITQQYVDWGGSLRASQALILGGKAFAALAGRASVSFDDIDRSAVPTLRSRVVLKNWAQSEGINVDVLVRSVIQEVRDEF